MYSRLIESVGTNVRYSSRFSVGIDVKENRLSKNPAARVSTEVEDNPLKASLNEKRFGSEDVVNDSGSTSQMPEEQEFKLYPWRWFILSCFCLINFLQCVA